MSNTFVDGARVAVLVAHPDDETLWCGGTLLQHPTWDVFIGTLCRASDPDRSRKFSHVLGELGAQGKMADLDDGPEQTALERSAVCDALLGLLGERSFDLVITHAPGGEYTRHRRHEEVSAAVLELWGRGTLRTSELWLFAYDDGNRSYLPRALPNADLRWDLPEPIWLRKQRLITDGYGFEMQSWEARVTPRTEAFWRVTSPADALARIPR